ncbi:hypothetical protein LY28_02841 [Ruminiclostridium sufflavum DSM 19573]|uniref:Uncharacterized protein n=1 Tax=Ruminiclostridium sufflavum DSM 19573 TaxID=1121337 RepID=A0A318XKV8_9FIRM|nr:hypothetical protein [Ruminiclostridium sufflavum]PYG86622.1 hypothetical protein LY28_02841 [Ruminiclostridium sufflavum DSM 19573]
MWKKPSIQKPDFIKADLNEISEKESLETNGGLVESVNLAINLPDITVSPFPTRLSGMIAKKFDFTDEAIIKKL